MDQGPAAHPAAVSGAVDADHLKLGLAWGTGRFSGAACGRLGSEGIRHEQDAIALMKVHGWLVPETPAGRAEIGTDRDLFYRIAAPLFATSPSGPDGDLRTIGLAPRDAQTPP
jgi:hypothetical protein